MSFNWEDSLGFLVASPDSESEGGGRWIGGRSGRKEEEEEEEGGGGGRRRRRRKEEGGVTHRVTNEHQNK